MLDGWMPLGLASYQCGGNMGTVRETHHALEWTIALNVVFEFRYGLQIV